MSDSFGVGGCVVGVLLLLSKCFGTSGFLFIITKDSETPKSPQPNSGTKSTYSTWIALTNQPIAEKSAGPEGVLHKYALTHRNPKHNSTIFLSLFGEREEKKRGERAKETFSLRQTDDHALVVRAAAAYSSCLLLLLPPPPITTTILFFISDC